MVNGKRNAESQTTQRLYDTSKCQVRFRKPRILQRRSRNFDQDRELDFDPNRLIDARLQGVIFRTGSVVGFRNIGVSNIEDVKDKKDWPDVGPAAPPDSMRVQRSRDWEQTWGSDVAFDRRWGGQRKSQSREYLYSQDRIKPQLSYYSQKKPVPREPPIQRKTYQQVYDPRPRPQPSARPTPQPQPRSRPKVEVISEPVYAPPSTTVQRSVSYSVPKPVNPKDQKRAFAFNEYALALMESGEYERAMNYFQKALDLDPSEETYTINMNRCREWLDYKQRGGRR
ncbi:MAG: tetratricopeptide repeat protein [Thermoplasmatota archaeon]